MPRHILLVIACLANDTDSGPDDKMMKMFTLGCRTVQSFAKLRLVSLVYHCLSLASNRRHTALYKYIYIYIFRDYGLCRGDQKVVDYSEDLHSLALEDAYLIWKSHMITDGWDLSLWLSKELR